MICPTVQHLAMVATGKKFTALDRNSIGLDASPEAPWQHFSKHCNLLAGSIGNIP